MSKVSHWEFYERFLNPHQLNHNPMFKPTDHKKTCASMVFNIHAYNLIGILQYSLMILYWLRKTGEVKAAPEWGHWTGGFLILSIWAVSIEMARSCSKSLFALASAFALNQFWVEHVPNHPLHRSGRRPNLREMSWLEFCSCLPDRLQYLGSFMNPVEIGWSMGNTVLVPRCNFWEVFWQPSNSTHFLNRNRSFR